MKEPIMQGPIPDLFEQPPPRCLLLSDYEGSVPRWCSGCGDLPVLAALQRVCRDEQLEPEKTVVVSGIGCSSRLPHYMHTYGYHGLHGRALPTACGVRCRRPDLHIFVATGDGDCCAIGTAHWIHAIRYNMNMVVMLLDNNIYGLTKNQTSPTTPKGRSSNTQPRGGALHPLNPISVTLSVKNASFVAQTVDWNPLHLHATLLAAHQHPGFAFVRILQRCPHYMGDAHEGLMRDPSHMLLMTHEDGIPTEEILSTMYPNQMEHDPADLAEARQLAEQDEKFPIGLFYRNRLSDRYDKYSQQGMGMKPVEKLDGINKHLDRFQI